MSKNAITLSLKNTLSELESLRDRLAEFGESASLTPKNIFDLNLVLDELFTNIVCYGQKDDPGCNIEVTLSQDRKTLTLSVEDSGIPFNPLEAEIPDLEKGIEERAVGGMGIHIVKSIVDEIQYQRKGNKNILTLTKRL